MGMIEIIKQALIDKHGNPAALQNPNGGLQMQGLNEVNVPPTNAKMPPLLGLTPPNGLIPTAPAPNASNAQPVLAKELLTGKTLNPASLSDAWKIAEHHAESTGSKVIPPVELHPDQNGNIVALPNPKTPPLERQIGSSRFLSAHVPSTSESDPRLVPGDNAAATIAPETTTSSLMTPKLRSPYDQRQDELQQGLAARAELEKKTGAELDKHKDGFLKNMFKGLLQGGLSGLASGNGLAGALGGAVVGAGANIASPHLDERMQKARDLAEMDAANVKRFEALKGQSTLDAQRTQIEGVKAVIDDRKADNKRNDERLSLDNKKATARDSFDEWRMKNGDRKQQSYEQYAKARLELGDKQLLSRSEYQQAQLEFKRDQLAQAKEIADNRNQTSLNIAGQNNNTRRDISNQTNQTRTQIANGSLEQKQKAAEISGKYKASDIIAKGRANLLSDEQINEALKMAGFPPLN